MKRVYRIDSPGKLRVLRTEEGFLLTQGKIAKPGIMIYRLKDGTTIRELVTRDVLNDEVSNATLIEKAFTNEHPQVDVTTENWQAQSHGNITNPRYDDQGEDGEGLYTNIAAKTRAIISTIERGDALELSPGYTVEVDETPGNDPEFGDYDTRQVPGTRRYNHVALTKRARGGRDLLIRTDSAIEVNPVEEKLEELKQMLIAMAARLDKLEASKEGEEEQEDSMNSEEEQSSAPEPKAPPAPAPSEKEQEDGKGKEKMDSEESRLKWFNRRARLVKLADAFEIEHEGVTSDKLKLAIVKHKNPGCTRTDSAYLDAAIDMMEVPVDPYEGLGTLLLTPTKKDTADQTPEEDEDDLFFQNVQKGA